MSRQVYRFTKSGSLVTIVGDPSPTEDPVTVRRVDTGKEMLVNRRALVPHDDFDADRMSEHAAQAARTLVAEWDVPADVAVRLAKGIAVTAEAVRVLRGRNIELSGAGMEFVARECFKIAAEDDALPSPAGGSKP